MKSLKFGAHFYTNCLKLWISHMKNTECEFYRYVQKITIKPKQVCMRTQHCFLKISQYKWSLLLNVEDYEISSPHLFPL